MKTSTFILILIFTPSILIAQKSWLSAPESNNQFRGQVESIKPDTSQLDLMVLNKTIELILDVNSPANYPQRNEKRIL